MNETSEKLSYQPLIQADTKAIRECHRIYLENNRIHFYYVTEGTTRTDLLIEPSIIIKHDQVVGMIEMNPEYNGYQVYCNHDTGCHIMDFIVMIFNDYLAGKQLLWKIETSFQAKILRTQANYILLKTFSDKLTECKRGPIMTLRKIK
ncbi:MAG: hypothetical protein HFG15_00935 [Bacilli bacterium]|nr:hypothetical protein [Bacilli bacterium]